MECPAGQLDSEGSVGGAGQHGRTLWNLSGRFSEGARCLQTWRQGIWLCGYIWVTWVMEPYLPHAHFISLSTPKQSYYLIQGRSSSLPVASSSPSWVGRVCVSVVLLFYTSTHLWAAWSPRKLIVEGTRFCVPFKCLGTHHCVHALR